MIFLFPKVSRFFNIRIQAGNIDFLKDFTENLINQKRAYFENVDHIGKANNLIELLLEANSNSKLINNDFIWLNKSNSQIYEDKQTDNQKCTV